MHYNSLYTDFNSFWLDNYLQKKTTNARCIICQIYVQHAK